MIDPVEALGHLTSTLAREAAAATTMAPEYLHNTVPLAPPTVKHVGDAGKTTLWIVFAVMLLSSAGFAGMSWTVPLSKRLFHTVTTLITITAAISYFAMATGHAVGWSHTVHGKAIDHHGSQPDNVPTVDSVTYRQIFWGRYVDWAITTPLLLIDLGLLAGLAGGHLFMAIVADIIMILTGLFAAFPETDAQKWGWYAIACVAFLVVIWHLAINGRRTVAQQSDKTRTLYGSLALYTIVLWTAYPIIWGFAEGGGHLGVDGEIIAYAVLDILAKPIFGFWLLYAHGAMSEGKLDVGGWWSHGLSPEGAVRLEDDDGA